MIERRPALGKGLSALIPDAPEPPRSGPMEVDIDLLAPSDQQPRLMIDDAKLEIARDPSVWWQGVAATVAMFGLVLAFNIVGDALRDALDPKLQDPV